MADLRRRVARLEALHGMGSAWPNRPLREWTDAELEAAIRDGERGMSEEDLEASMRYQEELEAMTLEELEALVRESEQRRGSRPWPT